MSRRRSASLCLALVAVTSSLQGCKYFRHQEEKQKKAQAAAVAKAQKKPKPEPLGPPIDIANDYAYRIFQRTASTGMIAVVVRGDETWMAGYGHVSPANHDTPQADTLFRLCSISKILATDLLSKLVAMKKVSLDDPLQKYAPQNVTVPTMTARGPADRPVELVDLATHTAGMPREIAYPPQGAAHFTFPDYDYRWQWLPQYRMRSQPGTAAHYSNIGFDLLGDAVASASGMSYLQFFQQQTAQPLGLKDTTLTPTPDECARLMGGMHEPIECTDTQAAAGSGGMYSTANDMAKVLRYFLNLPGVPIHANELATQTVIDPANLHSIQGLGHAGLPDGLGLGWIEINKDYGPSRIVQKTGGGAGFQTYIALNPARHTGIFFARTEGRRPAGNMFREANDMLLAMVGLPPVPEDTNDPERELSAEELRAANAKLRGIRHGKAPAKTAKSAKPTHAAAAAKPAAKPAKSTTAKRTTASTRTAKPKPHTVHHKQR
ncbi:D-alanyl-D-alanine-carboxypeptidase/endopeptidase AmpH [Terriglobus sp. TAA 43]|uniref:D-alanyl-D-alanine- carboxypeptidase/endopeptidase AmpH n=1 Tax=Terriglobus sp. TAA 43 TaxID=278961 RepID=UPI00068E2762|nr:D-alanyl-D-alanine-carboxypeptidase/endopeptidase AmpH [Terriglobus sp. TAA 43]